MTVSGISVQQCVSERVSLLLVDKGFWCCVIGASPEMLIFYVIC